MERCRFCGTTGGSYRQKTVKLATLRRIKTLEVFYEEGVLAYIILSGSSLD